MSLLRKVISSGQGRVSHPPLPALQGTDGKWHDLSALQGVTVLFTCPRPTPPNVPKVPGWIQVGRHLPIAPQARAFAAVLHELEAAGAARIFGISTSSHADQKQMVKRARLPFHFLSDQQLLLSTQLNLPTFEVEGQTLLERGAMILRDGKIQTHFHPVLTPERSPSEVLNWLKG